MGELDLAGGGGGLAFLELERAGRQLEMRAAEPDGAGRDQHHLAACLVQARHVVGQGLQPVAPDLAPGLVDQDRGADLDDQPLAPWRAASRGFAACGCAVALLVDQLHQLVQQRLHALAGDAGDHMHGLAAGLGQQRALGLDVFSASWRRSC